MRFRFMDTILVVGIPVHLVHTGEFLPTKWDPGIRARTVRDDILGEIETEALSDSRNC